MRAFPQLQVVRAPHHAAGAGHIVHLGFLVGKDSWVTKSDRVQRHVLPNTHGALPCWSYLCTDSETGSKQGGGNQ